LIVCTRLQGKQVRTTVRDGPAGAGPGRASVRGSGPDWLWFADIAYVPTWAGFLYRAIVLDVYCIG
jgi:putative transposase